MSNCFCDHEPAEVYRKNRQTARKTHRCYECNGLILNGERYEYVFHIWEGHPDVCKTCPRCLSVRDFLTISLPCYCWSHRGAFEDAEEQIDEAYYRARDEVQGLRFGYLRRKIIAARARASIRSTAMGAR